MTSLTNPAAARTAAHRPWLVPGALVAAVGGPLLLVVTNLAVGFTPGYDEVDTTADVVRVFAAHPGITELHVWTGLLGALLLVPAVWAVAARLAPRSPRLAAIGGWAMASGYLMSIALPLETMTALAVATSGADPVAYGTAIDGHTSAASFVVYGVFGIGALGGGLVLGIAMLRQGGALPLWVGLALILSEPVRVVGLLTGVPVGPPLASLLILVAFAATVRRLGPARTSPSRDQGTEPT